MDFDEYTLVMLTTPDPAPEFDADERALLQDAHLAFQRRMQDEGLLLSAGPVLGPEDRRLRGVGIWSTDVLRTRELVAEDPAVAAGVFDTMVRAWLVPAGTMSFTPGTMPSSSAEARS